MTRSFALAVPRGRVITFVAALLLVGLTCLQAGAAEGAPIAVLTVPDGDPPAGELEIVEGTIPLALDEALAIALGRNLGLAIERYTRQQFRVGIDEAQGLFDLRLSGFGQWLDSTSASASQLAGAAVLQDEQQILNLGLNQLTPFGGDLGLSFNNSRLETNNTFFRLNPSFDSSATLTYTQPLLRDFGVLVTNRPILVARLRSAGNHEFFAAQVTDLIQRVENAYWDLVESNDQLGVAEEALRLAEELHRRNRIQVDVGTLPPLELVRSDANVATRQEEIIRSRTAVGDAADRLRLLLNLEQGPAWEAEIVPTTDPRTEATEISLESSIATALAERPELAQQRIEVERLELDRAYFRHQVLPRLDLGLAYGLDGTGGDLLDPDTGQVVVPGGLSDALDQIRDANFDNWRVNLTFAYPLQNRAARAQSLSARLELEKGATRLTQLEQTVITEVRTAVRGVAAAVQQIESAGVSRRLQERNLDAEEKRYENGMSTSFEVTRIQEDLTRAKSREVTAVASYRRALAEYYRAIGRLIEETGVELVEPGGEPLDDH